MKMNMTMNAAVDITMDMMGHVPADTTMTMSMMGNVPAGIITMNMTVNAPVAVDTIITITAIWMTSSHLYSAVSDHSTLRSSTCFSMT